MHIRGHPDCRALTSRKNYGAATSESGAYYCPIYTCALLSSVDVEAFGVNSVTGSSVGSIFDTGSDPGSPNDGCMPPSMEFKYRGSRPGNFDERLHDKSNGSDAICKRSLNQ
jgi:hypothetical protein